MATEKFHVLDNTGVFAFALEVFRLIEDTYVRRTTYESALSTLNERITVLEIFDTYTCEIDPNGNLVFRIPEEDDLDLSIDANGDLILNSYDTTADKALEHYSFNIEENGALYLTIDVSHS